MRKILLLCLASVLLIVSCSASSSYSDDEILETVKTNYVLQKQYNEFKTVRVDYERDEQTWSEILMLDGKNSYVKFEQDGLIITISSFGSDYVRCLIKNVAGNSSGTLACFEIDENTLNFDGLYPLLQKRANEICAYSAEMISTYELKSVRQQSVDPNHEALIYCDDGMPDIHNIWISVLFEQDLLHPAQFKLSRGVVNGCQTYIFQSEGIPETLNDYPGAVVTDYIDVICEILYGDGDRLTDLFLKVFA